VHHTEARPNSLTRAVADGQANTNKFGLNSVLNPHAPGALSLERWMLYMYCLSVAITRKRQNGLGSPASAFLDVMMGGAEVAVMTLGRGDQRQRYEPDYSLA